MASVLPHIYTQANFSAEHRSENKLQLHLYQLFTTLELTAALVKQTKEHLNNAINQLSSLTECVDIQLVNKVPQPLDNILYLLHAFTLNETKIQHKQKHVSGEGKKTHKN